MTYQPHQSEDLSLKPVATTPEEGLPDAPTFPERIVNAIYALRHSADWIGTLAHGDNCYLTDEMGRGGCWCGKEAVQSAVMLALEGFPEAMSEHGDPLELTVAADRLTRAAPVPPLTLSQGFKLIQQFGAENDWFGLIRAVEERYAASVSAPPADPTRAFIDKVEGAALSGLKEAK